MIRGQKFNVVVPQKSIDIEAKLHNRFDFDVIDAKTGEVKQRAYAENIILDKWWTQVFTPARANTSIHVGTGTGTLAPSRTSLFNFLAGKASVESATTINEAENWISHKRIATWLETENMNTAWTEVGIAYSTASSSLTTHALIKDLNGNPVTLNKGATDIINVYSTVYAYLPAQTLGIRFIYPRKVNINLSDGAFLAWLIGCSGYFPLHRTFGLKGALQYSQSGYSGSWSGNLSLAYNSSGTNATHAGSAATKTLSTIMARMPASSFNSLNGVKSIGFGIVAYQGDSGTSMDRVMELQLTVPAPWYPYSAIVAETIGTGDGATQDFETYFPFVLNDGSFILKKNGTVIDPACYAVDWNEPNGSDLIYHLNILDYYSSYFSIGCPNSNTDSATRPLIYVIAENPWYQRFPISSFPGTLASNIYVADSPDGPWTQITLASGSVPTQYQSKRYWKFSPSSTSSSMNILSTTSDVLAAQKNIHFTAGNAPASGDVITADYHCGVIAKTENNVFDLIVNITLQEKVV